jgi:hypothetical protein
MRRLAGRDVDHVIPAAAQIRPDTLRHSAIIFDKKNLHASLPQVDLRRAGGRRAAGRRTAASSGTGTARHATGTSKAGLFPPSHAFASSLSDATRPSLPDPIRPERSQPVPVPARAKNRVSAADGPPRAASRTTGWECASRIAGAGLAHALTHWLFSKVAGEEPSARLCVGSRRSTAIMRFSVAQRGMGSSWIIC